MKFLTIDFGDHWLFVNPEQITHIIVKKDGTDIRVYASDGMIYNQGRCDAVGIAAKFGLDVTGGLPE